MSFRYQKRINLGKGVGLNVSQSGISSSYRTKLGSIGTRGFSLKTGIPGLTDRANWAKGNGFVILLAIMAIVVIYLVIYNVIAFVFYLLSGMYQYIRSRWLNKPIKNNSYG